MHKDGGGQKSYILDCVIWSCRQRREMGHQITHPSLTFSRFSLLLSPPFLIFPHSFFFLSFNDLLLRCFMLSCRWATWLLLKFSQIELRFSLRYYILFCFFSHFAITFISPFYFCWHHSNSSTMLLPRWRFCIVEPCTSGARGSVTLSGDSPFSASFWELGTQNFSTLLSNCGLDRVVLTQFQP